MVPIILEISCKLYAPGGRPALPRAALSSVNSCADQLLRFRSCERQHLVRELLSHSPPPRWPRSGCDLTATGSASDRANGGTEHGVSTTVVGRQATATACGGARGIMAGPRTLS